MTLTPVFSTPTATAGYVGVEIIQEDSPTSKFAYYALVMPDGMSVSGETNANGFSNEIGLPGELRPRTVTAADVRLSPGRYTFTLLTHAPALVTFQSGSASRTISVAASRATTAAVATTSDDGGMSSTYEYKQLPIKVPAPSHVALTVVAEDWTGNPSLDMNSQCFGSMAPPMPCPLNPTDALDAVNPSADDTSNTSLAVNVWQGLTAGDHTATFYSAKSGTMTHQTIIALALP